MNRFHQLIKLTIEQNGEESSRGQNKSDPEMNGDVLRTAYRGVEFPDVSQKMRWLKNS